MQELIDQISNYSGQYVYIRFNSDVLDFTDNQTEVVSLFFQNGKEITFDLSLDNFHYLISLLKVSVFSKGMKVITWDWKIFASYIFNKTNKDYLVGGSIIDLKIIESHFGIRKKAPSSINESLLRLKNIFSQGYWKKIENIYKKIYLNLSCYAIPNLENSGVIDTDKEKCVYAYYEINGQENGRLRCYGAFKNNFVPHCMSYESKKFIKPAFIDDFFVSFDFKAMEVFVLSWLSKDPLLEEVCSLSKDVYLSLYEKIFEKKAYAKSERNYLKKLFLPVIYGQSAYSLSKMCDIPKNEALLIIDRINSLFSVAKRWVDHNQQRFKEIGFAEDHFCRRRFIEEDKDYLVRNFCIQSPAALVCQEKLIDLFFALKNKTKIAFMVHDSYIVYANKENFKDVLSNSKDILLCESNLCPGLKLKVNCQVGKNLNELRNLKIGD